MDDFGVTTSETFEYLQIFFTRRKNNCSINTQVQAIFDLSKKVFKKLVRSGPAGYGALNRNNEVPHVDPKS
ncbi:MAG: hypothetical protein NWS99_03460, partial [Paracoccaceae bacterium]|nr:hypothetical protein [Paracoccaceae bacterium]